MNNRRIIKPLALAAVLAATGSAVYHFYGPNRAAVTGKQRGGAGTGVASVPITTALVKSRISPSEVGPSGSLNRSLPSS